MFAANIARMLVASPGDVLDEREAVREVTLRWNSVHSEATSFALLPTMWEYDSTPSMSDRPQGVLNEQLADVSDLLIGIFWTRLGTPTGEAESGTVEEIERLIAADKPVLLYFSTRDVPHDVNTAELERLRAWKASIRERGLYHEFHKAADLSQMLYDALTRTVRAKFDLEVPEVGVSGGTGPRPLARVDVTQEVKSDSKGRIKTSNRYRLVIANRGKVAAEELSFTMLEPSNGEPLPQIMEQQPVSRLMPEAEAGFPMFVFDQCARQIDVQVEWLDGGERKSEIQSVSLW